MNRTVARTLEMAALVTVLGLGVWLRHEPVHRAGGAHFDFDWAFHTRMVEAVVVEGRVPERDLLGLPPAGKPVPTLLPTLLYDAVAGLHRVVGDWLGGAIGRSIFVFNLLTGSLTVFVVYTWLRTLRLGALAALAGALALAVCPGHVERTMAHKLRYDGLGTLFLVTHVAAVTLAPRVAGKRWRVLMISGAALALAGAVASWRVALGIVAIECVVALAVLAAGRLRGITLATLGASLGGVLLLALTLPYLVSGPGGPFLLTRGGVLIAGTGIALLIARAIAPQLEGRERIGRFLRPALVTGVLALVVFAGRPSPYDAVGATLSARWGGHGQLGRGAPITPEIDAGALLAGTGELQGTTPAGLFGPRIFGLLLLLVPAYPLVRVVAGRGAPPRDEPWVWHGATVVALVLTLLFTRSKVLAAPLVAGYAGMVVAMLSGVAGGSPGTTGRRRTRGVMGILVVALLAWTGVQAFALARQDHAVFPPETGQVIDFLAERGEPGDVVLCEDWGRGYVIQLYAGLATVTDGFLESPEMRRRLAGFARALYATDEEELARFCRLHDVRFLWLSGTKRQTYAGYVGIDHQRFFDGNRPTDLGWQTNFVRLLARPDELVCFTTLARIGSSERILEFEWECAPHDVR